MSNRPAFSILKTLGEACRLWARYWKVLVLLSVIATIPTLVEDYVQELLKPSDVSATSSLAEIEKSSNQSLVLSIATFVLSIFVLIVDVMKTAAVLGLLKETPGDVWSIIRDSIRKYSWILIKVQILLSLMAAVITVPVSMLAIHYANETRVLPNFLTQIMIIFFAIVDLVFVKFALAGPLVVSEGKRARESLKASWQMTRGRFGYVFGCYVLLGIVEYFLSVGVARFEDSFNAITVIGNIITELIDCLWGLLGWVMYQQIKSVEAEGKKMQSS